MIQQFQFWLYPKERKSGKRDIFTPIFIAQLFTLAKVWKLYMCPSMDEWIKMCHMCVQKYVCVKYMYVKNIYTHTHTQKMRTPHFSAMRNKEISPFKTNMDGP